MIAAKKLNITGYFVDNALSRISVLKQFEIGLQDLNINTGGIVTGRHAQQVGLSLFILMNIDDL